MSNPNPSAHTGPFSAPDSAASSRPNPSATPRPSVADKRRAFHALHRDGCFILPNPWDVGSALYLQQQGFKALASTSAGMAWSKGHADNQVTREMVLSHLAELVAATDLPVNADFESGFGQTAAQIEESVGLAVQTGVAGLSIEDSTLNPQAPLYPLDEALARLKAARRAIDKNGGDTLLVGRCEAFLWGQTDLDAVITRLRAYANAGADCLYAPGVSAPEQIKKLVDAVAPKPFNLLVSRTSGFTLPEVAALGVRRISVGGALARAAWGGFIEAALGLTAGRFDGFGHAAPGKTMNGVFKMP